MKSISESIIIIASKQFFADSIWTLTMRTKLIELLTSLLLLPLQFYSILHVVFFLLFLQLRFWEHNDATELVCVTQSTLKKDFFFLWNTIIFFFNKFMSKQRSQPWKRNFILNTIIENCYNSWVNNAVCPEK